MPRTASHATPGHILSSSTDSLSGFSWIVESPIGGPKICLYMLLLKRLGFPRPENTYTMPEHSPDAAGYIDLGFTTRITAVKILRLHIISTSPKASVY